MEPMSDATVRTSLDKGPDRGPDQRSDHGLATGLDAGPATGPATGPVPAAPPVADEPGPVPARSGFRLHRSRTDRMLGGVCGGLAESLGVDAALLRIGLIAITLLGAGIGVVLYLAAWLLAPEGEPA